MTNPLPVVDRDDLVTTLDSGFARRALLEDLAHEYPRTGVGARAQAEADEFALTEQRTVLVARREKAEEAVLALRTGRGGQLVKELRRGRELRQVDARGQQVVEVVPVAGRGEHPLLLRGHIAGVVPAAAAPPLQAAARTPTASAGSTARHNEPDLQESSTCTGAISQTRSAECRCRCRRRRRAFLHIMAIHFSGTS